MALQSFGPPHERTNPYITQLFAALPPEVEGRYFSWRAALLDSYDVFHVQWPEVMYRGRSPMRGMLRLVLFVLTLVRVRLSGRGYVRTLHNLAPHEAPNWVESLVVKLSDRWTDVWVLPTGAIEPPTDAPTVVAPLGDYRQWFADRPGGDATPGRLVFFGLVRKYKGVEPLISQFAQLTDDELSLHVVGAIDDAALATSIEGLAASDSRVVVTNDYVPDEVMLEELAAAELVVLPFAEITNSSSLVLALSVDRPVLVPAAPSTLEVQAEVGPEWVITYEGELDADTLTTALSTVRTASRAPTPDLSQRSWSRIGALHAEAYRQAAKGAGV